MWLKWAFTRMGGLPWMAVASKLTNCGHILRNYLREKALFGTYREAPSAHRTPWSGSAFRREGVGERGGGEGGKGPDEIAA